MPANNLFYKYEKSAKDPKIVNRSSAIFLVKYSISSKSIKSEKVLYFKQCLTGLNLV